MALKKMLPGMKKSFSFTDQLLTSQGFVKKEKQAGIVYEAKLQDATTQEEYSLNIPATLDDGGDRILLGQAFFEEKDRMPTPVLEAANSKLNELTDYLKDE